VIPPQRDRETNTRPKYAAPLVFRQKATGEKTMVKARFSAR